MFRMSGPGFAYTINDFSCTVSDESDSFHSIVKITITNPIANPDGVHSSWSTEIRVTKNVASTISSATKQQIFNFFSRKNADVTPA